MKQVHRVGISRENGGALFVGEQRKTHGAGSVTTVSKRRVKTMNKGFRVKILSGVIASVLAMSAVYAQDTTSGVSGRVVDAKGTPVAGAKVKIVHVPSGTTSNATTDANGRYVAQGLRVGGPNNNETQVFFLNDVNADHVCLDLIESSTGSLAETAAGADTRLDG